MNNEIEKNTENSEPRNVSASNSTDLLARLNAARDCLISMSDIAIKQKNTQGARKLEIYAIAIYEATEILKNKPC